MSQQSRGDRNSNQSQQSRGVRNSSSSRTNNNNNNNNTSSGTSNSIDEFLDWLETVDIPSLSFWQKVLVYGVLMVVVIVIIATFTGHAYSVAVAFVNAIDGLSTPALTAIIVLIVVPFEIIGVNTTLLALAVGYVYGRRYSVLDATIFATIISFVAICIGCLIAYFLGATVMLDWALELQERNDVFRAIDHVLGEQGLKVNLLLRLTLPDCIINFSMGCSRCTLLQFTGGFFAMIPWILAHAWYGAQIENLTDKVGGDRDELITFLVGLIATTLLSVLLIYYTKSELKRMLNDQNNEDEEIGGNHHHRGPDHRAYRNSRTENRDENLNNEIEYFTPAYLEIHENLNAKTRESIKPKPQNDKQKNRKQNERTIGASGGGPRGANGAVEMM